MNTHYLRKFRKMAKRRYRIIPLLGEYRHVIERRENKSWVLVKDYRYEGGYYSLYDARIRLGLIRQKYIMNLVQDKRDIIRYKEMYKKCKDE